MGLMVSSMQTAHYYRQRLDAGELYFLALDPLKNGGWRGLLVRHYVRPEKAKRDTVPKSFFRLWEHVASVPPEVEKRFNDAGNLGTMRNRRKRPSAGKVARCKAIIANLQRNKNPTDAELKQLYDAARKAHAAGDTTTFLKMSAVLEMFEPRPKKYSKKIMQEFGRRARNSHAAVAKKPRKNGAKSLYGRAKKAVARVSGDAKSLYGRAKKAVARVSGEDKKHAKLAYDHALGAVQAINAYRDNHEESDLVDAKRLANIARQELDRIDDPKTRESVAPKVRRVEQMLGIPTRNRSGSRNGKRRNAGVNDDKFWGGAR